MISGYKHMSDKPILESPCGLLLKESFPGVGEHSLPEMGGMGSFPFSGEQKKQNEVGVFLSSGHPSLRATERASVPRMCAACLGLQAEQGRAGGKWMKEGAASSMVLSEPTSLLL